jgi:tetratricopeptide (TPR) repeat protein
MPNELTRPAQDPSSAPALDVFISYAREDRGTAQVLAAALSDSGASVWWDRQIAGGQDFANVIAGQLAAARLVLVLWSSASVVSSFVRDEAAHARDAGKLLPLRIEDVRPPLGFGTIHTLDLLDWDGDLADPAWLELLANVTRGAAGWPQSLSESSHVPWRRWQRPVVLTALLAALAGAGTVGWHSWREQQALDQFQLGLSVHFAQDRNLQAARNAYLNALEIDPGLGRAHYYLAHVYALLMLPRDARAQFDLALQFARDLDPGQRDDARVQLTALNVDREAAPVTRSEAVPAVVAPVAAAAAPGHGAGVAPAMATQTGASPAPAPAQLPRVAPSPEQQRVIAQQVAALFAPLAQQRLSAATALALDPGLMSDTVVLALERALSGLQQTPSDEAAIAGATNTLQLLLSASPATLKANRDAALRLLDLAQSLGDNQRSTALGVRTLLDKAQSARAPVVYIQIANEAQRPLAQALAERMRASGYAVPALENVGARAPARSEVRVQGGSVQGWGRWLSKVVSDFAGEPAAMSTLRGVRPANDTFEIWLDKDLCVAAQRQRPLCAL